MARPLLPVSVSLFVALATLPAAAQDASAGWSAELLVDDLATPVDLVFGPDGTLYYAELNSGKVRAIPAGQSGPRADAVIEVDASGGGNGGLLGVALDPDFERTGAFFVYYSFEKADADNGKVNRVSRVDASGERVLLDDIPWAQMHDGGRLVFTGPDTLVVATGDNELRSPAQDRESLLGKTLRMTREGQPAPDNPDPTSYVYTLGHRNPFGLAYDAASGTLWQTENGPHRGDEVNVLVAGGNYGWPDHLGATGASGYVDPVIEFDEPIGPTGATVLHGDLYFGDFNDGAVHRVTRAADGSYRESVVWAEVKPVLDVEAGPDGNLYVSTYKAIYVVAPPAGLAPLPTPSPTPSAPTTPPPPPSTPESATTPAPTSVDPPPTAPPEESAAPPTPTGAAQIPAPNALPAIALLAGAALAMRGRRG